MLRPIVRNVSPGPVYGEYFADPFVWRHEDRFYAIGTGPQEAEGTRDNLIFPLLVSDDLKEWQKLGKALERPVGDWGNNFWAPEVAFINGTFYLYYSVGFGDTQHQMRVASSRKPDGPYTDCGVTLLGPPECPFAIDPHPFRDAEGVWHLFYATDFLNEDAPHRAGTGLMVAEMSSPTRLKDAGRIVLRARCDWQCFQRSRQIYGGKWDWHTLEGPCVLRRHGRYYCLYSGGRWENDTYGVDYGVAEDITGPYSDAGNDAGARVLRTIPGKMIGPGHNSVVEHDGKDWIVFHAWDSGMNARRMYTGELCWE